MSDDMFKYEVPKFRGFSFDYEDPRMWEKYERAHLNLLKAAKKPLKDGLASTAVNRDIVAIRDLFDEVFGKGAGAKILGKTPTRRRAYEAWSEMLAFVQQCRTSYNRFTEEFIQVMTEAAKEFETVDEVVNNG